MTTCPWKPCGQELTDTHDHPEHRAWSKDKVNDYVPVKQADGAVDVYRKPKRP